MEQKNDYYKKVLTYKTGKISAKIPRDKNTKCWRNTKDTKHSRGKGQYIDAKYITAKMGAKHDMLSRA